MKISSKSVFHLIVFLALLANSLATYTPVHAASTLYVKETATGSADCSSWDNACTLQTALANSIIGDQIWVMAGTYKPTGPSGDRTVSFVIKSGVAVYGGYTGTGTQRDPDPATNGTILSGDLNSNDNNFTNNAENSYHVVWITDANSLTALDGFTIRGGNANGTSPHNVGGGLFSERSSPTLSNLTFFLNSGSEGGGIWNNNNNNAQLTNVIFSNNFASNKAGGMRIYSSNPTLTNVTFSNNSATNWGGGIHMTYSNPTLTNVTFSNNTAANGGGLYNYGSNPILINLTFSKNSASSGGGMRNDYSNPILTNVTFSDNSAPSGGGLLNYSNSIPTLTNTIIANSPNGGDCVNQSPSTLNAASSNNLIGDASNACGLVHGVNGNIVGYDPLLDPLADNGGFTQTHALQVGSLAIDTGKDSSCPTTDQRGEARAGYRCDIGAYESPFTSSSTRTISGNVGATGVTLSYVDGTPKTVLSQAGGSYILPVGTGWTGTVTPSLNPCYAFNPTARLYNSSVVIDQAAQDYALVPANCINVKIGNTTAGIYTFPSAGTSTRQSYNSISDGPVRVSNFSTKTFISSERIAYQDPQSQKWTSFSELMGFPLKLASTRYSFPFYNNKEIDTQLRIGNLDLLASTLVNVRIGSQYNQTFALNPNQSIRVNPKIKDGPVVIQSSGGVKIIASMRVAYQDPQSKKWTSFSEMMGMPDSQLSTSYLFPWFNNQELNSQLRIGNVGASRTGVQVWIGGVLRGAFYLDPNTYKRVAYPLNDGPVLIKSSSQKIVASASVSYTPDNGTTWTNVSEMMGFPISSLSTTYHFPWYNNDALNTQLRFGNVGNAPTTVTVTIGGQLRGSYNLLPNESTRASYLNLSSGPVVVQSSGNVPIIVSQRVAYLNTQTHKWTSYSEMMGMPASQLTNSYVFPWYNNSVLDTQIRYGVP